MSEKKLEALLEMGKDWLEILNKLGGIYPEMSEEELEVEKHLEEVGLEG